MNDVVIIWNLWVFGVRKLALPLLFLNLITTAKDWTMVFCKRFVLILGHFGVESSTRTVNIVHNSCFSAIQHLDFFGVNPFASLIYSQVNSRCWNFYMLASIRLIIHRLRLFISWLCLIKSRWGQIANLLAFLRISLAKHFLGDHVIV